MRTQHTIVYVLATAVGLGWLPAGDMQASELRAHVHCTGSNPVALGSATHQQHTSVGQAAITGPAASSASFLLSPGFPAMTAGLDTDGDGTADGDDSDADGDSIADAADARPYDTDNDGANNVGADNDDDGDRLTDAQEQHLGTSPVLTNTDGDAHDDYAEYIAGTDGTDSGSVFRVRSIAGDGAGVGVVLRWMGAADRLYRVLATNSLAGAGDWIEIGRTNAPAAIPIEFAIDTASTSAYYRVGVNPK